MSNNPYYLYNDDCLAAMKGMAENSVDAIVTDPPYGLSFMGKDFDTFHKDGAHDNVAFHESMTPIFAEAIRVAKPGAHLLAFGGSRTYHRLACAIEDAGWEVRDCIMWVYGSGFPKSLDVSKAIAKRAGGDLLAREAIDFMCVRRKELGLSRIEFEKRIFGRSDGNVRNWEDGISLPNPGLWNKIKKAMELNETPYDAIMERGDKEVSRENGSFGYQKDGVRWTAEHVSYEASTDIAKKWNGYGTCLKPAYEPVIVARKPLDGTVSANVLKWGVGAINIDGCRVPSEDDPKPCVGNGFRSINDKNVEQGYRPNSYSAEKAEYVPSKLGRWPANLVHDGSDEVLACFPDSKGQCGAVRGNEPSSITNGIYGKYAERMAFAPRNDSGTAARFFYCAKASRSERGEGNTHPTIKPLALMRWLITMVAPPDALVLDPFMGSGSTGVAALQLNRRFIGVEREKEYYDIAMKRISDFDKKNNQPTLF